MTRPRRRRPWRGWRSGPVGTFTDDTQLTLGLARHLVRHPRVRPDALIDEITAVTDPLEARGFIVFHDAYQYFETRFGLNAAGSITLNPERKPGAKRLYDIRRRIIESGAHCVFQEPQFEPKSLQMLVESSGLRTGVLDPEGVALENGSGLYFSLLRGLADELLRCLT